MVAAMAVATLPDDFPAFARSPEARERIQFLSGEPDRWRSLPENALRHMNDPDHYCDFEAAAAYNLTPETFPEFRNELIGHIYVDHALHPEKVSGKNESDDAKVYVLFGLLPYSIQEHYLKLKAEFSYLRGMINNGAPSNDIHQAEQNILYTMGILSHFAGDGSQPLHLSVHHHGWVGDNPHGYSTHRSIHSLIDGDFIEAAHITTEGMVDKIKPASVVTTNIATTGSAIFPVIMSYLTETHRRLEPLYQLEKNGKLDVTKPSPEGCQFIEEQLLRGGQFLGDLYYSAYHITAVTPAAP